MDSVLETIWLRAATIDELLSEYYYPIPGEKTDADRAARRLAAWCRNSASGDWDLFSRRLARDGLSIDRVLPRLATIRRNIAAPIPNWVSDAEWILTAIRLEPRDVLQTRLSDTSEPIAFERLLFTTVDAAEVRLSRSANFALAPLSDSAHIQLSRALLIQLAALCQQAFYERFLEWRQNHSEPTQSPDTLKCSRTEEFDAFVSYMQRVGMLELFVAKPVLLRLIASITRQWIDSTNEFTSRLTADMAVVRQQLLNRASPSFVTSIVSGLSDPHNFGRTVFIVRFDDGARAVYKPKDIRVEGFWFDLVRWLNLNAAPEELRAPKVLLRDGYGWSEFIENLECIDRRDAEHFFHRAGALLALLHILAATDIHGENIIACADHPVPIDLEMIFHSLHTPSTVDIPECAAFNFAAKKIADSVIETRMLPAYGRASNNQIFGVGGMHRTARGPSEIVWIDANTDNMRPAGKVAKAANLKNMPKLAGVEFSLGEFGDIFCNGFESYARYLSENRKKILEHTFFEIVDGLPVRRLLRPTRFYYLLLSRLSDCRSMEDGAIWSANLDFVARLSDWDHPDDQLWPLFRAERSALTNLNIPFFSLPCDGLRISDQFGSEAFITGESGLHRARERLERFDASEVAWQSNVVRISTSAIPNATPRGADTCATPSTPNSESREHYSDSIIMVNAQRVAAHISEVAIRRECSAAWIGIDWLGDSEVSQLIPLGSDLYNGAPGVSLFLAAYSRITGDAAAADLALAGIAQLRFNVNSVGAARFARSLGVGGATGVGSVVYALTVIGDLLGSSDVLSDASAAARLLTDELIAADRAFDVMGGSAGAILSLLKLRRTINDPDIIERAIQCGQHLLRNRPTAPAGNGMWVGAGISSRPLTGMSHGAAGFFYSLASLFAETGREEFAHAANDCLEFENSLYSQDKGNWPDLREVGVEPSWPCQWCHGAGGIGLSRIGALAHWRIHQDVLMRDIGRAVSTAEAAWPHSIDTLCCGNLGNIELLDEAATLLDRQELRSKALRRLMTIIEQAQVCGDYRWKGGQKNVNLGLFRGIAGVGYTLLRRASPDLPNVLIWE